MKYKNILFIIGKYPNIGGTEKITTVLANYFATIGCNVFISSFIQPRMDLIRELDDRIKFIKLKNPVNSKNNLNILHELLQCESINLIINQFCLPYYTTRLLIKARKGLNCKIISVLHGVPDNSQIVIRVKEKIDTSSGLIKKVIAQCVLYTVEKIIKASIKYVYNNTDAYVVLSKGFIDSFKNYIGIQDSKKLYAISNPITISTDYSVRYSEHKKKQILYVGRMAKENKRVNRIIEAWEEIAKDYPDWNLKLVGGGPQLLELQDYVIKNDIPNVSFTGFVQEEPIKFYKESSILMLTSDLEGFGLVVVEGMAYGVVPVVYGGYASIYEIINEGKSGFITPYPYSKKYTVEKLRELIENPDRLYEMSIAAQDDSKRFSLGKIVEQWGNLINGI